MVNSRDKLVIMKTALVSLACCGLIATQGVSQNVPVVDFGDDLCWFSKGMSLYRYGQEQMTTESLGAGRWRIGYPFRLDRPLNSMASEYNQRGNNTRFYGGLMTLVYNSPDPGNHFTEGFLNADHDGFDDLNFMAYSLKSPTNQLRAFGVWLWKKADFLNGGDRTPVTFDGNSRIGVYLSRTYPIGEFRDSYALSRTRDVPRSLWRGWEAVHLLVQEGDQFFVARSHFAPREQALLVIQPAQETWARYTPREPWDFEWDEDRAVYAKHDFKDVQAAGWMIAKPTRETAALWLKWYAFGMDAVVRRPPEAEAMVPMVRAGGLERARDAVTYAQWIRVYKWASRNQYCLHEGYNFNRDGNPGRSEGACTNTEPVTGITWQDAALWCNALSEYEGRSPCYYEDEACTRVLRSIKDRSSLELARKPVKICLKPQGDGYRLPSVAEWMAYASTLPEACYPEYLWDVPSRVSDPEHPVLRTVVWGGGASATGRMPEGSVSSRADNMISFRPVRGEGPGGFSLPDKWVPRAGGWNPGGFYAWSFAEDGGSQPGDEAAPPATLPELAMVELGGLSAGKTEVTYRQWREVFTWAERHGYRFDRDGDMGSLQWDDGPTSHSDDEPVTSIGILDAMVWCNALSEMSHLSPCYYADAACRLPLREVHPARVTALAGRTGCWKSRPVLANIFGSLFHTDPQADGFRLPSNPEWTDLAGPSSYPCGETLDLATLWALENSGQRTHPVGRLKATGRGFHDLAGNVFEWTLGMRSDAVHTLFPSARGGSFRSESKGRGPTPLGNSFIAANWAFGGSMNAGLASPEIGFRIVRNRSRR